MFFFATLRRQSQKISCQIICKSWLALGWRKRKRLLWRMKVNHFRRFIPGTVPSFKVLAQAAAHRCNHAVVWGCQASRTYRANVQNPPVSILRFSSCVRTCCWFSSLLWQPLWTIHSQHRDWFHWMPQTGTPHFSPPPIYRLDRSSR